MFLKISNKFKVLTPVCLLITSVLSFSCGLPEPDPQQGSGKGSVALFITDNISFYKQVVSTITGVRLINSGTGGVCELMKDPVTFDISNLTNMAQYTDLAECAEGRYNRIDINFKKDVIVMDQLGAASTCAFTSFIDENDQAQSLVCDQVSGICTLSMRAEVQNSFYLVQEDRYNDLGIDFDLKQFTITDFGIPASCAITMAVSPLSAADMNESGRAHAVSGSITDLDIAADTFTLTYRGVALTVDYSGILPALQPNIDQLLLFAESEGLLVNVLTGAIDFGAHSITANRLYVKTAGTASSVISNPTWSFTLEYVTGKTMAGSQKQADIQGDFIDGAWVNVKFDGYDSVTGLYQVATVEVLPTGTVLDD